MNEPSFPWTRRQLQNRMRAAGWVKDHDAAAVYRHPDGGCVNFDQLLQDGRLLWRWYAQAHQLPDPALGGAVEQRQSA